MKIELEYGDILYKLVHITNGFDSNQTNDVHTILDTDNRPKNQTIEPKLEKGPAHAIAITGKGAPNAKFKIKITSCGVDSEFTVDENGDLLKLIMFNVH